MGRISSWKENSIPLPNKVPSTGKVLQSDGEVITSTSYTLPKNAGSANDILISDGTDIGYIAKKDLTAEAVKEAASALQTPTVSLWNAGTDFNPVLPKDLLENGTSFLVGGDTCAGRYCSSAGKSCTWKVPNGVTEVEFQIWGGGGNSAGCNSLPCCSIGSPGGNGEYTYVRMKVTPGDTYTICAGGAATVGACYSYCNMHGCNSFVCGSNNTCILSCGGTAGVCGYANWYDTYYPGALPAGPNNNNSSTMFIYSCVYGCLGKIKQSYRYYGNCVGNVKTSNKLTTVAKVPSTIGTIKGCGGSICYATYCNIGIDLDNTFKKTGVPYTSQCNCWGCFHVGVNDRFPGQGAVPVASFCGNTYTYGDRGTAGLVKVTYK